jgi:hypothetical protein
MLKRGDKPASTAPRSVALMCVLEPSYREYILSKKSIGRPFRKGASGNPAGRPRTGESIAEYIRELGGPDGRLYIDRLHALATEHSNPRAMLAAIGVLLERGFGRPPQTVDIHASVTTVRPEAIAQLTDEELEWARRISRKLTGVAIVP